MSAELTASAHYTSEDMDSSLRFMFPYRRYWFEIVFLSLEVFVIFFYGPPFLIGELRAERLAWPLDYVTIVLLGMALVVFLLGLTWALELLWLAVGKEVVEISNEAIVVRHQVFNFSVSQRSFPAGNINGVFVSRHKEGWWTQLGVNRNYRVSNFRLGKVAFNGQKKLLGGVNTFRFGANVTEEEAKQIVDAIEARFPRYRYMAE
jgi:hypothetical protein